jgi:hypothetical protein
VVGLLTLTVGAALGGELVYRHGRRVELEPAVAEAPTPPPASPADPDHPASTG